MRRFYSEQAITKTILILFLLISTLGAACQQTTLIGQANKKARTSNTPTTPDNAANTEETSTNANATDIANQPTDENPIYPTVPAEFMQVKMKTLDGKVFKLEDYKGKVLIVNFWASWCGPCRMEMPELVKISNEYKEKGVEVVGLTVDELDAGEQVKAFAAQQKVPYRLAWSNESVTLGFMQENGSIPQSFVISREGKLMAVFRGYNPERTPVRLRQTLDKAVDFKG